jgi:hypothetical protein
MQKVIFKKRSAIAATVGLVCILASASAFADLTISGTALSGLIYRYPPEAQYVPAAGATPDLAALSTPDSGLNGDAPVFYFKAANVGLGSLGPLSDFWASYHLYSSSGGNGNQPYWLTYLYAPDNSYIGVVTMGGPDLNGSSPIHVFYDYDNDPNPHTTSDFWGATLSSLETSQYNPTTTFGQLTVYESGVEIGNWNIPDGTPASANIDSITTIPEPGTFGLVGMGLVALLAVYHRRK